jgi:hypothetical protein
VRTELCFYADEPLRIVSFDFLQALDSTDILSTYSSLPIIFWLRFEEGSTFRGLFVSYCLVGGRSLGPSWSISNEADDGGRCSHSGTNESRSSFAQWHI